MQAFPSLSFCWQLFRFSLVSLPYLYFAVFPGFFVVMGQLLAKFRRTALEPITGYLVLAITGFLLLSSLAAANREEALLQLANFLPYLLLFSLLPYLLQPLTRLGQLATDVVIATIPINLLALLEYVLRSEFIPRWVRRLPLARWYRSRPHVGRAMVMFGHPNALAGYLVLILGLGLGLLLYHAQQQSVLKTDGRGDRLRRTLLYIGTFACLLGIFSSGSRNGLLVALSQLLLVCLFAKPSRKLAIAGLMGVVGLIAGAALLGIGRRSLDPAAWTNDPRIEVWRFAGELIQQRPWLGWGLGNFKLLYPPGLIPDYEYIAHPHNVWLLLAAEAGLPMMMLFTLFVGRICYRAVRRLITGSLPSSESAILLAYLLSFWGCLAFALFDVTFYDARINAMHWVVLAGLYTLVEAAPQIPQSDNPTEQPDAAQRS
ncbi:MAG: O-antigen ligase family protein [Synechococcales cyanobacterium C42_A2020_086]|jgi:O-antigen ligase|nr:O-antigen ligase family protein [Synechococcales cyanobacterium C42_A2020_086]